MDRQLFSHTSRVSGRRGGAVPVSLALHGIVIGGAVLASVAMMPPLPDVEAATPKIPVVLVPPAPVRAVPVPPAPPKGRPPQQRAARPPESPVVRPPSAASAPAPDLSNVSDIADLVDGPPVAFGPENGQPTEGCVVGCVVGPISTSGHENGTGDGGPRRVHTGVDAPARIHFVKPAYPRVAILAGVQGDVVVDCVIGPDGKVYEAKIISGNPLLQQAALDAVRQWRYTRPRLNDTPISVLLMVTVKFGLQR